MEFTKDDIIMAARCYDVVGKVYAEAFPKNGVTTTMAAIAKEVAKLNILTGHPKADKIAKKFAENVFCAEKIDTKKEIVFDHSTGVAILCTCILREARDCNIPLSDPVVPTAKMCMAISKKCNNSAVIEEAMLTIKGCDLILNSIRLLMAKSCMKTHDIKSCGGKIISDIIDERDKILDTLLTILNK